MKRLFLSYFLCSALPVAALAALQVSQRAPDFSAQASLAGKAFTFTPDASCAALLRGPVIAAVT